MAVLEVRLNGKWKSFSLKEGSDVLRRCVNLDTGEVVSYLGKQLQGRKVSKGSSLYWKYILLARRAMGFII